MYVEKPYELAAKIFAVNNGTSKIFADWQKHGDFTKEEFIAGLCWLCDDPLDKTFRYTRVLALSEKGLVRVSAKRDRWSGMTFFYKDGRLWSGEKVRSVADENSAAYADLDGYVRVVEKICITCFDRV